MLVGCPVLLRQGAMFHPRPPSFLGRAAPKVVPLALLLEWLDPVRQWCALLGRTVRVQPTCQKHFRLMCDVALVLQGEACNCGTRPVAQHMCVCVLLLLRGRVAMHLPHPAAPL